MSYILQFDGVNDVVTLPTTMVCSTGTTSWIAEFRIAVSSYPVSGNRYFTGVPTGTSNGGFCLRQASGDGALALVVAGVNVAGFTSPVDYILNDDTLHTYRIERDAGADVRFYRDDMFTPFATVSWVTGTTFSLSIGRFGSGSTSTTGISAFNLEYFDFVSGFSNAEKWDSNLSGGTGSILPTVSGSNQGTLVNFDIPACWIFYSTGASWEGTIGKTSLTVSNKQLFTALGYQTDVGLLDISTTGKQQSVSAGYSNVLNKSTEDLSNKQLILQAGAVLDLVKYTEDISYKQLEVQAGTSVSFTGLLNKQNYPVTYKQLSTQLGWSGSSQKQTLFLSSKQESVNAGFVVEQSKQSLILNGEQLSIEAGSSISFVGTLSKQNYLLSQKALGSSLGAVVTVPKADLPVSFKPLSKLDTLSLTIGKSSLSLTGKALGLINGHLLEAQKRTLNLVTKQLNLGEIVYPIVPVERLFTIEHKNNIYIFKQNINVHIMKGK